MLNGASSAEKPSAAQTSLVLNAELLKTRAAVKESLGAVSGAPGKGTGMLSKGPWNAI